MSDSSSPVRRLATLVVVLFALLASGIVAWLTADRWLPLVGFNPNAAEEAEHAWLYNPGGGHEHGAHEGGSATEIELSPQALKNVGFEPFTVRPTDYDQMLTLPAIVVERPGRSQRQITAPLTGVVTDIHAVTGQAVEPDELLIEMRLTHEELVAAQRDYLRTAENLEIVNREIKRLESLGEGVVAGRRLLEQQYEKQKLEVSLRAEGQAMLLHGLSKEQVETIRTSGQLFQTITIRVPAHEHPPTSPEKDNAADPCNAHHPYQIQRLAVSPGEQVEAGQLLMVLGDHCLLHLEGLAFADDAPRIRQAAESGRKMTAQPLVGDSVGPTIRQLDLLYVADAIDPDSRAYKIYLNLPNRLVRDQQSPSGNRFIEWLYKPGQRMQIAAPVETWTDQLVLPASAVVVEAAEAYVYRQHEDHFTQTPVHILHRDAASVVIANDGALAPNAIIAGHGAFQIHLALKNKSGAAIDPHAGHNH